MPTARTRPDENSENSKANRIETMKGPAESGQICSVGRRKIAKKIAKNKRCYANTLRPRSRMLLKGDEGGLGGHYPLGHLRRGGWINLSVTGNGGPCQRCARRGGPPTPPPPPLIYWGDLSVTGN